MTNIKPTLQSLKQLDEKLNHDEVIQDYLRMAQKVHQNDKLLIKYEEYIAKQKEIVKLAHYQKPTAKAMAEAQLAQIEEDLFMNPLFNEYMNRQVELNELFQDMTYLIEDKVKKHLSEN
ncbi:MAG: YlbF family regulator [Turicibacter sp.]